MEHGSTVPARRFVGQAARDIIWAVFNANLAAILLLWWVGSGHDGVKTLAGALTVIGRVSGLIGTYVVPVAPVLRARVPGLDDAFGMEGFVVLPRRNGFLILWLL